MSITWVRVLTCALPCPIHVTNPTDMPSPGAFIRTPGDRQHVDEQAFPWDPFQGTPGHTQVCDSWVNRHLREYFLHPCKFLLESPPIWVHVTKHECCSCDFCECEGAPWKGSQEKTRLSLCSLSSMNMYVYLSCDLYCRWPHMQTMQPFGKLLYTHGLSFSLNFCCMSSLACHQPCTVLAISVSFSFSEQPSFLVCHSPCCYGKQSRLPCVL